jgi:peptidoglycan/LPS O-acetylase OafA/YrhL
MMKFLRFHRAVRQEPIAAARQDKNNSSAGGRVAYLDLARGVAILGVMAVHTAQTFPTGIPVLQFLAWLGQFGVQLFFIVSAFTMCLTFESRVNTERRPIRNFLIRRFARLAPPFWFAMLIYAAFSLGNSRFFAATSHGLPERISSIFLMQGFWPTTFSSTVPGGGSIATEAAFYLIFPVLFLFRRNVFWLSAAGCLAVFVELNIAKPLYAMAFELFPGISAVDKSQFFHYYIGHQLSIFLIGIVAYELIKRRSAKMTWLEVFCFVSWQFLFFFSATYLSVVAWVAVGLVVILMKVDLPLLVSRVLSHVGKISYSLYLFHFAVINGLIWLAGDSLTGLAGFAIAYCSVCGVTALFAVWVSKPYLEDVGTLLGKRVVGWNESSGTLAAIKNSAKA